MPPVPIRPSVAMDIGGGSNEDDLTVKLQEIIDINASVKAALDNGANVKMIVENWDFLQVLGGDASFLLGERSFVIFFGNGLWERSSVAHGTCRYFSFFVLNSCFSQNKYECVKVIQQNTAQYYYKMVPNKANLKPPRKSACLQISIPA